VPKTGFAPLVNAAILLALVAWPEKWCSLLLWHTCWLKNGSIGGRIEDKHLPMQPSIALAIFCAEAMQYLSGRPAYTSFQLLWVVVLHGTGKWKSRLAHVHFSRLPMPEQVGGYCGPPKKGYPKIRPEMLPASPNYSRSSIGKTPCSRL
jgi:hypothetical protein